MSKTIGSFVFLNRNETEIRIITIGLGLNRWGNLDGRGNFQTFQQKQLDTPIGLIYNKVGVGNLESDFFIIFVILTIAKQTKTYIIKLVLTS